MRGIIFFADMVQMPTSLSRRIIRPKLLGKLSRPQVKYSHAGKYDAKLSPDARKSPVEQVLAALTARGQVVDISISDPPLEEVIAQIYQEARAEPVNQPSGA